ncbi:hypothetical protein G7070_09445 [Propioniciclava coleopterorum]|uniref:Uncharacterized protein n=1 Tax=Propioniciclava coleopterorum TaxID=2714937 RepID=A0A6G7Y6N4_9ACTN|nr:hypothetical protein [Propioniciclava coleopterorum]QIK72450.1 hypothetical protein G7070_09445 [Propioniciclava coleopterorum]
MSTQEFVIRPRPAVRAFALAAAAALLGALALVGGSAWGWGVVGTTVGIVLMLGGLGLAILAVVSARRQAVTVSFDDEGFRVASAGEPTHTGTWSAVTRVTGAPGRLTLHEGDERRTHLIAPRGSDADLDAIGEAIGHHLDADRGYTAFEG